GDIHSDIRLTMGARYGQSYFNGWLAEPKLHARALSPNEVLREFEQTPKPGAPANDLAHVHFAPRPAGAEMTRPDRTVYFDAFPASPALEPRQGLLQRELFRQGLMIAARDELGLATRDRTLRDGFPADDSPRPATLGVIFNSAAQTSVGVTVFRES